MTLSQQEKETLLFQQEHCVYDDCQLSYRVNLTLSLLVCNLLSFSLLAALWTSLAQNIQSGARKEEKQLHSQKICYSKMITNCCV